MDAMKAASLRLGIATLLFASWLGFLAYLALTASKPIVLSRPQFLLSQLDVIAQVEESNGTPITVSVRSVHWPQDPQAKQLEGKPIHVTNLRDCLENWQGSGVYILPLVKMGAAEYRVAPQPPSPGFPQGRPRVYPATPETLKQLDSIQKPEQLHPPDF
jgi:hypothetical protein